MNRVAVLTGAAGFLGSYFTKALLGRGYLVYGLDICGAPDFKSQSYFHRQVDITDENSVREIFAEIAGNHEKLDLLVNNAAIDHKIDSQSLTNHKSYRFEDFDHSSIFSEFQVGIVGSLNCTKHALRIMIPVRSGIIVNVASDLSVIAPNQDIYHLNEDVIQDYFKPVSYSIIKHGQVGLTKYLATYCAPYNIRCNSISPGPVLNNQPDDFLEKLKKQIPLGRLASPHEIAGALVFLASPDSTYLTGHNLVVDGGRTIW